MIAFSPLLIGSTAETSATCPACRRISFPFSPLLIGSTAETREGWAEAVSAPTGFQSPFDRVNG